MNLDHLKANKRQIIERHVRPNNRKGLTMVLTTLLPVAALFYAMVASAGVSYWLSAAMVLATGLFLIRAFVLMHDCGHGSLFRSARLNRSFGFVLGVFTGMPHYVWARHHQHHHATNGNWDRYRGPLNIIRLDEYEALTSGQKRRYRNARSLWMAPLAGLMYVIVNPRLNWLMGSFALLVHMGKGKVRQPRRSLKALAAEFVSPHWSSANEYRHMCWNSCALLALLAAISWLHGSALFVAFYVLCASLAGAAGIVLFTVQHNFDHAYASGDAGWDYDRAVLDGTSHLVLPAWLNWFTANIGYHHIHHLSARIPSYCLVACHEEFAHLFVEVRRIGLAQIPAALRCMLWDAPGGRIVSLAEARP